MADRASAAIFGDVFNRLALAVGECSGAEHLACIRGIARDMWANAQHYDFHAVQMGVELKLMVALGFTAQELGWEQDV
jgi:hypothetical protein